MTNSDYLSKNQTIQIRAILCMMVVFGHSVIGILENTGPWAVSVFFFLSGYALTFTSLKSEVNGSYIIRKYRNIILPFALVAILYHLMFYKYPVMIDYNSILGTVKAYLNFTPTVQAGWYIEMMLVLFTLFFIAYKLARGNIKKHIILQFVLYLLVILYVVFMTTSYWTIMSAHSFIIGVAYCYYKDKIEHFIDNFKSFNLVGLILILMSVLFTVFTEQVGTVLSNILLVIVYTVAPVVVIFISSQIKLRSKILTIIGERSLWIYMTHVGIQYFVTTAVVPGKQWPYILFFLMSFVTAFVLGSVLKLIYDNTIGRLFGHKK